MTRWADPSRVSTAIAEQWSSAQIECRAYGHNWKSLTVYHRPGTYTITQRCARCRNERQRDINEAGSIVSGWAHTYRNGYLIPDSGRIASDGRDLIRLASLNNLTIVEVTDEETE